MKKAIMLKIYLVLQESDPSCPSTPTRGDAARQRKDLDPSRASEDAATHMTGPRIMVRDLLDPSAAPLLGTDQPNPPCELRCQHPWIMELGAVYKKNPRL